jgi:membrane associated rhomboid family serine protease
MMRRLQWRLRGFLSFSSVTVRLVAVSVLVHIVLLVADRVDYIHNHSSFGYVLQSCFALSWPLLSQGFFWQPLTYLFLHSSWLHLFLNMWALSVFGGALERDHGSRFVLRLFFSGGIVAAFGWLTYTALLPALPDMSILTAWLPADIAVTLAAGSGFSGSLASSVCLGASGGVFALLAAYLAIYPERQLYVLLFFVIPLKVKCRTLLWILLLLTFCDWFLIQSPIAHSSHLAGGILGYLAGRRIKKPSFKTAKTKVEF